MNSNHSSGCYLLHGRHYVTVLIFILGIGNNSFAQRLLPEPYAGNDVVNYIRTWEATGPETDPGNLTLTTLPSKASMATQYFDGLGRPLQMVVKQGSLITGGTAVDILSATLYDEFGRESYKYLPFAANATGGNTHTNDGLFKLNPFQQPAAFYDNANPANPLRGQGETFFYGKTVFEPSPLNRVDEVFAPGNNWAGTSDNSAERQRYSVKNKYWVNTVADDVRIWDVTNAAAEGDFGGYSSPGAYLPGELYKNVMTDEAGRQVIEFTDRSGLVVLKKVQLSATADDGLGSDHTGWLCTYYIYDDLNHLRCILLPRGLDLIKSNWKLNNTVILAEQCVRYEYDQRGRVIVKKAQGTGEVTMVYDKRNRLVMTQGANQKGAGQWLVTRYDGLDRPKETGLWTNSNNAAWHRDAAGNLSGEEYEYPAPGSNYEMLTQTYYDDYEWISMSGSTITNDGYETAWDGEFDANANIYPYPVANAKSIHTRDMVTGMKTKVLGTPGYLYTMLIYDGEGRVIQTKSTNITEGTDVVTTQYGWQGLPLVTVVKTHNSASPPSETITTVTRMTYDELGRVTEIKKKQARSAIDQGQMSAWHTISEIAYDALGQVKTKKLAPGFNNNTGLETLDYDYNIRGWLLGANRDYISETTTPDNKHFGFDLGYDKKGVLDYDYQNKQYNGNISGTIWRSAGDGEKRKYDYSYDNANRLMLAYFGQYNSNGKFSNDKLNFNAKMGDGSNPNTAYDANGNIKLMYHYGFKFKSPEDNDDIIDKLSYEYQERSNKLLNVTDTKKADYRSGDFRDGSNNASEDDYAYDDNGNLTRDANK